MPKLTPKLRFTLILPFLFVSAGVVVRCWQAHLSSQLPAKREYPFEVAATLIYRGLDAPVVVLQTLWGLYLPFYHSDQFQVVLGIPLSLVLFFVGVTFLWATVGIMLDRRLYLQPEPAAQFSSFRILFQLLLLVFAGQIFFAALFRINNHLDATNPNGAFVEGCLYLAWSLVLAVYGVQNLLKTIRAKRTRTVTMTH